LTGRDGPSSVIAQSRKIDESHGQAPDPNADGAELATPMAEPSKSTPSLTQGTIVNERYEIRQSLGKGGMGEVFLAFDRSTQQPVALKVIREEAKMAGDEEALRQELLHARSVSHPNVCRVHDLAPSVFGPILVMEHIAGQTLHTHIRRRKAQGGYRPDEFRKIASEACAGLAAIHAQGLVHGDLKPGNVMVSARASRRAAPALPPTAEHRTTCRRKGSGPAARARRTTSTRWA
jgi:serine/threonine protein kinase